MFEDVKNKFRIRNLARMKIRVRDGFARNILKAREEKAPREKIHEIRRGEQYEVQCIQEEVEHLQTQLIYNEANKLRVPIPADAWMRTPELDYGVLTDVAYAQLRNDIRSEKAARREERNLWIPSVVSLVTAVAGLIGTVAGLVAVLSGSK